MVQPGIDASRQDTNRPFRLLGRLLGYVHFLTHPPVRICPAGMWQKCNTNDLLST